jgi:small ligand-binding sensory domain FIST
LFVQVTPAKVELKMASGLSALPDTIRAAEQACEQCLAGLEAAQSTARAVDTAFLFFSAQHVDQVPELASTVLRRLSPKNLVGISTVAAVGGSTELERSPGISILAAQMPGVAAVPFVLEDLPPAPPLDSTDGDEAIQALGQAVGISDDLQMTMLLADPFSVPLVNLLPALNRARTRKRGAIFGGMASASNKPGGNALILNDRVLRSGGVGLSLKGKIHVDTVVSQGCRPFGPTMVVTKAKGNMIFELGGKPSIDAVQEAVEALGEQYRQALAGGLFVGRVIDEYKGRFGRNDFLISNVVGVDPNRGALAVAGLVRVGQTIRLHVRDAVTASEDLALLLDAQKLYDKPKGALLVTCNGRGKRMFTTKDHDAAAVAKAFSNAPGGEELSKPGLVIDPAAESPIPLAGFFAAGEIGPIGEESFVHGHTACLALFRDA